MPELPEVDRTYTSRKFLFAIGTSVAMMLAWTITAVFPAFRIGLEVLFGGLIAVLTVYLTGNVATNHLIGKNAVAAAKIQAEPTESSLEVERLAREARLTALGFEEPSPDKAPKPDLGYDD